MINQLLGNPGLKVIGKVRSCEPPGCLVRALICTETGSDELQILGLYNGWWAFWYAS